MKRLTIFFIQAALLTFVVLWLSENPGDVSVNWLGYAFTTSIAIFLLFLSLVFLTLWVGLSFLKFFFSIPSRIRMGFRRFYRKKGRNALHEALLAYKGEDAKRLAAEGANVEHFLDEPGLGLWLKGEGAALGEDKESAKAYFRKLCQHKGLEFLGYQGLIRLALAESTGDHAFRLIRQALAFSPDSPWLLDLYYQTALKQGVYEDAAEALDKMKRAGTLETSAYRQNKAKVLKEWSKALDLKNKEGAFKKAEEAFDLYPSQGLARLYIPKLIERGKKRKALKYIEKTWKVDPHEELASLYLSLFPDLGSREKFQKVQKLVQENPTPFESRLALGRWALEAQLWDEAREHLTGLLSLGDRVPENIRRQVLKHLSDLEIEEHNDFRAALKWYRG